MVQIHPCVPALLPNIGITPIYFQATSHFEATGVSKKASKMSLEDKQQQGEQMSLMDIPDDYQAAWKGMPEYNQKDLMPWKTLKVHFRNADDRSAFSELLNQRLTPETRFVWFPTSQILTAKDKVWTSDIRPRYPIFVPTKGRSDSRLTIKTLEEMVVPYSAVVVRDEVEAYSRVINHDLGKILVLPDDVKGLVPTRNWIKHFSIAQGDRRHWQIDDNINGFFRLCNNTKIKVNTSAVFRAMEDFSDRYTNVAISGPNYVFFAKRKQKIPPFLWNTRVYSCSLVNNEMPYFWRDVYNDDTDICLRALKDGNCTVQFNAFLSGKSTTMTVKGGNTPIYQGDGRRLMAESLLRQHPDVVTITEKFGHVQHQVNYSPFKRNKPLLADNAIEASDYGMELVVKADEGA
jgi:TET-Associated Glycosyltransferase